MKTAEILSTFQEKLLLKFEELNSVSIEIKNSTPQIQTVQVQKYEADYNTETEDRIHKQLRLCRCKNAPFFKWITQEKSFYGFGNLFNNLASDDLAENLFKKLSDYKELPFFHALPFPSKQTHSPEALNDKVWDQWNFPHFMVPEVSLEIQKNKLILTLIQNTQRDECSINGFDFLKPKEELSGLFKSENEAKAKNKEALWNKQITNILAEVSNEQSPTTKVVLARTKELSSPKKVDPTQLFNYLSSLHKNHLLTHFFLGMNDDSFFGFSPENLLKREGKEILIDAIAGTRPRSDSEKYDLELEQELKNSQKEQAEHANVIDAIKKSCLSLGEIRQHQQVVLKLSKVQHLKTPISLLLSKIDRSSIYRLAKTLHPTPAVGGTPRQKAIDIISELEGFKRGLYAGAIGLQTEDSDQFIVAIRSLKTSPEQTTLFAGAGIVLGSNASDEWNETEAKFNSFFPPELLIQ